MPRGLATDAPVRANDSQRCRYQAGMGSGPMASAPPTRRRVLRDLGIATALTPFIPFLDREREALGAAEPRRLVLVWVSNAPVLDRWLPQGTERDFTLGPILAPFEK